MPARKHAFLAGVEQGNLPAVVQSRLQLRRINAPDVTAKVKPPCLAGAIVALTA
jgi:hypothetical protein